MTTKKEEQELAIKAEAQALFDQHEAERLAVERIELERESVELLQSVEERERIRTEKRDFEAIDRLRKIQLRDALDELKKFREWDTISHTSKLPDVECEPDVNAYVTLWKEDSVEADGGEDNLRDIDADVARCDEAVRVLQSILAAADANTDPITHASYMRRYAAVAQGIRWTVANAVGNILHYLERWQASTAEDDLDAAMTLCIGKGTVNDEDADGGGGEGGAVEAEEGVAGAAPSSKQYNPDEDRGAGGLGLQLGLWAGNKVPRVRGIEYSSLRLSVGPRDGAHMPREMALMNHVAMLAMLVGADLNAFLRPPPSWVKGVVPPPPLTALDASECLGLSVGEEQDGVPGAATSVDAGLDGLVEGEEYVPLGGTFSLTLLTSPPGVYTCNEWLVRAHAERGVHRVFYPPTADAVAPPVRVTLQIPETVFIRGSVPIVGVWNTHARKWEPTGTSDFTYDATAHKMTFVTRSLCEYAVVQAKLLDVPLGGWSVIPIGNSEAVVSLTCRASRDEDAPSAIIMLLRGHEATLIEPADEATAHLRSQWYAPTTLLRKLGESGFTFVLNDADAAYFEPDPDDGERAVESIVCRDADLREKVYNDIAWLATRIPFASAYGNLNCEVSSLALFRMGKRALELPVASSTASPRDLPVDGFTPPTVSDADLLPIRYSAESCVVCTDVQSWNANMSPAPGQVAHHNLLALYEALNGSEAAAALVEQSDAVLAHSIERVLSAVRPLTWG